MAVIIHNVGISVPGQVTRKYDSETDTTTLTVNQAQAQDMYASLGPVLELFAGSDGGGNTPEPKTPTA